ncbi:NADH-quinone oxidoreductase subunit N, partial [Dehalococcoidia bacterium]|nr:NADH-quinone oxidoreductase subunit N [Dehalococcoidia bacterium]
VSAGELLTAYIGLELFSFCLYILAGYALHKPRSVEAGIKYILVGAFSSAMLLYGISLIYGALGTTTFTGMAEALVLGTEMELAFLAGIVLVIVGFGFKVTAVPFHMWAPDVYEGAPTPVTAYLSVASKAVSFALLLRLFAVAFAPAIADWQGIIAGLAVATIALGNLVAIAQTNIKRMLAYSSIGQAGYLLLGVAALSTLASNGLIFHLVGYSVANFLAFSCVIAYQNMTGKEEISDYAGLSRRQPFVAMVLSVSMFSLAGLPIFAGFATKFYLFTAAANQDLLWLVIIAVTGSVVSLYYYLMVIKQMYLGEPSDDGHLKLGQPMSSVLGGLLVLVVFFGVYPGPLIKLIEKATSALPLPV